MVSRKLLIAISVVVVVVAVVAVGLWMFLGGLKPPVDVYARATPSSTTEPASLLPSSVAGRTRTEMETEEYEGVVVAYGIYDGILITIARFNFVEDATEWVDDLYEDLSGGSMAYVSTGGKHWFTHTVSDESVFTWRKDIWVFEVYAGTETLRNNVVEELNF